MSSAGPDRPDARDSDMPWKLIVFGVLAVYAVLIVLLNRKQVEVSFVFFSARDLAARPDPALRRHRLRRRLPLRAASRAAPVSVEQAARRSTPSAIRSGVS